MHKKFTFAAAAIIGGLAVPGIALAQQTALVTTDLNMRTGPGPNYEVITAIPGEQTVTIQGCVETMSWCQVNWNGQTGWAYADYLAFELEGTRVVVREARPRVEIPIISDVAGAVGGAVGAVGETVGAIVGGTLGAVGAAITPPPQVQTYVVEQQAQPVFLEGEVVVGATLPEVVTLHPVPDYDYRYAVVNQQRVLVDPGSRRVVHIFR